MNNPIFPLLLLVTLMTGGCSSTPPAPAAPPPADTADQSVVEQRQPLPIPANLEAEAEAASNSGRHEEAFALWEQIAARRQGGPRAQALLQSALALIATNRLALAEKRLQAIDPALLVASDRFLHQRLSSEVILPIDPEQALALLASPPLTPESARQMRAEMASYYLQRARVLATMGNQIEVARNHIQREAWLDSDSERADNQIAIWGALSSLSATALQMLRTNPPPDELSGWMALVSMTRDITLPARERIEQLRQWRLAYPNHPIRPAFLEELEIRLTQGLQRPERVALLLPLTGRFAAAAEALLDGFLMAWFSDPLRESSPLELRLYDVGPTPQKVMALYQLAVNEGADMIVGPLDKEAVEILARQDLLPLPTLALNYAEPPLNEQLYQFALTPEDEAIQVAERAWQLGYVQAAMLTPESALGQRIAQAFRDRWIALGGTIANTTSYDEKLNDFSLPITSMLMIDESNARQRRLARLLDLRLEFTPRRRQDLDFIFVMAQPRQGRLIQPQLRFHHAGEIPILATSHIYDSSSNSQIDRDLDGIQFADLPWTLRHNETPLAKARQQNLIPLARHAGPLQRLAAMGADAYQLLPVVSWLRQYPYESYPGETGRLSLDQHRRIERQLAWAQFTLGAPRNLTPAARPRHDIAP
jgi:uncharacterized protein